MFNVFGLGGGKFWYEEITSVLSNHTGILEICMSLAHLLVQVAHLRVLLGFSNYRFEVEGLGFLLSHRKIVCSSQTLRTRVCKEFFFKQCLFGEIRAFSDQRVRVSGCRGSWSKRASTSMGDG